MENNFKIVIGKKMFTRKELFKKEEKLRKKYAQIPFEEKIKVLVELQKLAYSWGRKKNIIVWEK